MAAEHGAGPRRAAVLGHPVDHSLSPVLHLAAYEALGLDGWAYERIDCPDGALPGIVGSAEPDVVGFSVTMPGKVAALEFADDESPRARLVGSANTLVRRGGGWFADCTDVDGAVGALSTFSGLPVGGTAVVFGVGGTARPVLAGLADVGFTDVTLASRSDTAGPALRCAAQLGMEARAVRFDDPALSPLVRSADVVVSTVPSDGAGIVAPLLEGVRRLFDVLYDPWPTRLGFAAGLSGADVVGGDLMLLHQAFGQVELFTGRPAPREAMAEALDRALGR